MLDGGYAHRIEGKRLREKEIGSWIAGLRRELIAKKHKITRSVSFSQFLISSFQFRSFIFYSTILSKLPSPILKFPISNFQSFDFQLKSK